MNDNIRDIQSATEKSGSTEIMAAGANEIAIRAMAIDALVERVSVVREAMRRCMQDGHHYGVIPGTKKPSLWKPGAEIICTLFQIGTRYPREKMEIIREHGHFVFTLTCELFHIPTGRVVGEGVGGATTAEYRYKVQCEDRIGHDGQPIKAKFTPYDFYNTVLKIAKKRAMVDAVLTATGASDIFTQDTEDNPELHQEGQQQQQMPRRPTRQQPTQAQPQEEQTWHGVVEGVDQKEAKSGKKYFVIVLSGNRRASTFDADLADQAAAQRKQSVALRVKPGSSAGYWNAVSIEAEEQTVVGEVVSE